MKLIITIECDNDAFEADFEGEIERILADLSSRVSRRCDRYSLHDANGLWVGEARLEPTGGAP